jgi:C4-dicarboxylate-specific signal transduction histidine kinase
MIKHSCEEARIAALREYQILDTLPEDTFDSITQLAAQVCGTPIVLFSLVDSDRQWFKSKIGMDAQETVRNMSFCSYAILEDKPFIIEDAREDERFANNPLVLSGPKIVFYAGFPLMTPEGHALGTLCAIDQSPRKLTAEQIFCLQTLSREIMVQLELRKSLRLQEKKSQALKEQIEKFETVVNNIPLFMTMYNEKGDIEWGNRAFEETFSNAPLDVILPDSKQRTEALSFIQSSDSKNWKEFETVNKSREPLPTSWINLRLSNGKRIGIGRDISLQRQQENIIKDQQVKIISSAKLSSLGEMAAGIAHELNNPLTILRGHLQILSRICEEDQFDKNTFLSTCHHLDGTIVRMAKIIKGLNVFTRDCNDDPFEKTSVKRIVDETLIFCGKRFSYSHIKLNVPVIEEGLFIECRPVQLEQVLLNLFNNAFDAVCGTQNPWVTLVIKDLGDAIEFAVEDSGQGIPPFIQDRIMEPFYTTKEMGKGTGLGLSISKNLIETHMGKLELDKNSPHTRFVFSIPKLRLTPRKSA